MSTVGKLVVLKLDGDFEQNGFRVTLEIGLDGDRPFTEVTGSLPTALGLVSSLNQWQQTYRSLGTANRIMPQEIIYGGSVNPFERCQRLANELRDQLNQWLDASTFHGIDRRLRETLSLHEPIRVLIRTDDNCARRLPWHLWEFIERYTRSEIALSAATFERVGVPCSSLAGKVRILAILGNQVGIDVEQDRQVIERLSEAEVTLLVEPKRQQINRQLWEQPWDILFFAGHSKTENSTGRIYLNGEESLTLNELQYGLRQAIAQGLKLAIFNSCDGLGLAHELEQLHLPQLIVMREPVPDPVAQEFLKSFLSAYAGGDSLYSAERQARERLQGLEGDFPCASWLPVICQNPTAIPPTWAELVGLSQPSVQTSIGSERAGLSEHSETSTLAAIVFTDVKSFTAKMVVDEPHTLMLLQRDFQIMQQICQQFEGQILKSLGDGLLIFFVSAERAVSCAIAIQTQLAALAVKQPSKDILQHRIGIHLGEVRFNGDDVLGSGVNLAARLQRESPAGGICLSQSVYDVVKNHLSIQFDDGGFRKLKGIPDQVRVYWFIPDSPKASPTQRRRAVRSVHRQQRRLLIPLLTSVIATSLIVGMRSLGWLQTSELWAYDQFMQQQVRTVPDSRLLVVGVNDADMQKYGQTLNDRTVYQLLKKLEKYQPKVIGLDIFRDQPQGDGWQDLTTFLQASDRVVAICQDASNRQIPIAPPPKVSQDRIGYADTLIYDADSVIRRYVLVQAVKGESSCSTPHSLTFQILRHFLPETTSYQLQPGVGVAINQKTLGIMQADSGGYQLSSQAILGYQLLIDYRTKPIAQIASLTDILNAQDTDLQDWVRDRIVLIGYLDEGPGDAHLTPIGNQAGVMIHASVVSQVLRAVSNGELLLSPWSKPIETLWIFSWAAIGGLIIWKVSSRRVSFILLGTVLLVLVGSSFVLFQKSIWVPVIPASLALLTTSCGAGYLIHSQTKST